MAIAPAQTAVATGNGVGAAQPSDPLASALVLESQGHLDSALALLQRDATGSPSVRSELHLAAARMLARHHHFERALAEGREGVAANPADGYADLEEAKILDEAGRHAGAIALAQEAASRDPGVRFAAQDLIFQIQTHWGTTPSSPARQPPVPRPGLAWFVWLAWGLSLLLVATGAVWIGMRRPNRPGALPAGAADDGAAPGARIAERVVPVAEFADFPYGRALQPGDRIGPYQIERVVSHSLHSTLYRAEDLRLERPVALKQANPLGIGSEASLARFQKEVKSLIALSNHHDGVIKVYDYLPPATLVTEWVDGHNLDETAGDVPVDRLLQIAIDLCDVLSHAHSLSIIHRDIKPSNVMVSAGGRVKLLDFGIAKNAALGTSQLTIDSGVPIGTFTYMAPEQYASPDQARPESDLYSLGLSLYRLIAGTLPASPWLGPRTFGLVPPGAFEPIGERAPAIVAFVKAAGAAADLSWVADLDRIVRKTFMEDPGERYHTAAELQAALEGVLSSIRASVRS